MKNNSFRSAAKIIAIILGVIIFKHFNFSTLTFERPWLDVIYIIAFICILIFLFKDKINKSSR